MQNKKECVLKHLIEWPVMVLIICHLENLSDYIIQIKNIFFIFSTYSHPFKIMSNPI